MEEKQALIRIVEELVKAGSMTNSRMLGILNEVRKENGETLKKNCPANRQRITELCRKVLGDNLTEETRYSGFGIGRQPTRFGLKDHDEAMKSIEKYFSAPKTKTPKGVSQKRTAVGKLLSIIQKIDETPGKAIKKDTLKELIDAKSSVSMTLGSWKKMLMKDGIELNIKSSGGLYKIENLDDIKSKITALYEKLMAGYEVKEKKTRKPAIEKNVIEEDLTPEEESFVFLIAKTCDHKKTPINHIWATFKKQGLPVGLNLHKLIRRAGLKKWFVQDKVLTLGAMTSTLEFIGDLEVVASLLGQMVEKSILIRSSLEPNELKSIVGSGYELLNAKSGDNIYKIKFDPDSKESRFNIFKLYLGFRGGDGFIYDADEEFVLEIFNDLMDELLK